MLVQASGPEFERSRERGWRRCVGLTKRSVGARCESWRAVGYWLGQK